MKDWEKRLQIIQEYGLTNDRAELGQAVTYLLTTKGKDNCNNEVYLAIDSLKKWFDKNQSEQLSK